MSHWKAEDFLARKQGVLDYFKKKEVNSFNISEYCCTANIPIVVVCEFLLEGMPDSREVCEKKMASMEKFFGGNE